MADESLILDPALEHPGAAAYRALIQATSGLVGYWPLDDLASPYRDLVAGNSAVDVNSAGVAPRHPGARFDGQGRNRLRIAHLSSYPKASPNDPNVFSISFWFNWRDLEGVVATDESWTAFAHVGGVKFVMAFHKFLVNDLAQAVYPGNGTVRTGWHHFAMTAGGVTGGKVNAKVYFDGALAAEANSTDTFVNTSGYIALGNSDSYNEGVQGTLAEFAYFNRALTAAEVRAQYVAGAGAYQSQLDISDNASFVVNGQEYPVPDRDSMLASSADTEGDLPVQHRYKNREITVAVRGIGAGGSDSDLLTQTGYLQQKVAKLNREGGTLQRIMSTGDVVIFDVVGAGLDVPAENLVKDMTLKAEARPFGRGPAVTMPDTAETVLPALWFSVGGWGSYAQAILADAPLLYWRLGDSGSTVADSSGSVAAKSGSYANSPSTVAGAIEGDADLAHVFNGSSQYAYATTYNPFTVAASLSFEAWVYRASNGSNDAIFGGNSASATPCVCRLTAGTDTLVFFPQAGASASWASCGIGTGAWHHVVVTFDNANNLATLYVDGVSKGAAAMADDFAAITQTFIAGAWVQSGTVKDYFDGRLDEVAVYSGVLSQDQVRAHYMAGFTAGRQGIRGDVPGLGRLVVDEDQGAAQWTAVWGLQSRYVDQAASAALFFQAEGLTLLGGGAAASTAAAGYSGTGSVLANSLATAYQAILSSQASGGGAHWSHVGDFRVYARVLVPAGNSGAVTVRARWNVGDGRTWTLNDETQIPNGVKGVWRLVDLGIVSIPKAAAGVQRWELQLLAKSTVAGDDVHADCLFVFPVTEGFGVATAGDAGLDLTSFQARDEFNQAAGALTGKTPDTGGNWTAVAGSDADDFSTSGAGTATRTAVSDAATSSLTGRPLVLATPASLAGLFAQVNMSADAPPSTAALAQGLIVRYVDASNYLAIVARPYYPGVMGAIVVPQVILRLAGTDTDITPAAGSPELLTPYLPVFPTTDWALAAYVNADGTYSVWSNQGSGSATLILASYHSQLATGGTLASGKVGIIDRYTAAAALTRTYSGFYVYGVTADYAIPASQSLEVRHDRVIREDAAGALWQAPSSYKGDYLLIPPAGRESRQARLMVKLSRGQIAAGADGAIDDLSARLTYTPRYLVIPEP